MKWFCQWSCMDVRVGLWRMLSTEELLLLNCGVREDSWKSLGLQRDQTSQFWRNQSWIVTRRTGAEVEAPILWSSDANYCLIGKHPDAGKDQRWEEKGMTEDEMVGWHHWLDGHELEQALGVMDREAWHAAVHGVAKSWTWLSNWTELNWTELGWFRQ